MGSSMLMKRVTIQITMDYPAKYSPFDYIHFSGGKLISNLNKQILKDEELGDVDPPWGQKMREFNAVKAMLGEGIRTALADYNVSVTVYGYTNDGEYTYDIGIYHKSTSPDDGYPDYGIPKPINQFVNGLDVKCVKGTLTWLGNKTWPQHSPPVVLRTMSIGNPNIVAEITEFIRERIK